MTKTNLLGEPLTFPKSMWVASAEEEPNTQVLADAISAEVLIVGAGFTGLSAAIRLARAGRRVVVVDAAGPGWGASGRNNGQVIAGLKQDPEFIEALYPGELGRKLVAFGSEAPSVVFRLIAEQQIDCAASRDGWIQPAFTKSGMDAVRRRCEAWRDRGVATQLVEGNQLRYLLGTSKYSVGWIDPRGGSIHPLNYARGLARAAMRLGVEIFSGARVLSLSQRVEGWEARTELGSVTASNVILACGAYGENLVPSLRTSIVPVRTAQVATRPLRAEMRRHILPKGHVSSDTRRLLTSFRISPDGRLVMGGSGATAGVDHSRIVVSLKRAGEELFSHLGRLEWEYDWSGYFAVTMDHLPHVHEPERGLHIMLGCNGRGIAISTAFGLQLAERVLGASASSLSVPVSDIKTIRFHSFRGVGVSVATRLKALQDRLGF